MALARKPLPELSDYQRKRFHSFVEQCGPNECWLWTSTVVKGYGRFTLHPKENNWKSTHYGAHRIAYMLSTGEDPREKLVCHRCDNQICCNPKHFFIGTNTDNQQDSARKNRTSYGERHAHARLKESDIPKIHKLCSQGLSQQKIADEFCVAQTSISRILLGQTWKRFLPS